MVEKVLKNLGLNDKEIKIYLACLRLGPSPVRKIAQESGVNRGTAYDILRSLIKLGLVSYYHKDKNQYFIAENPEKLKEALDQKQKDLEKTKLEISEIIPQLRSIYDDASNEPVVKFYEGELGIKKVLQDVLSHCDKSQDQNKEYYVYSSSTLKKYLYDTYPEFSNDRIKANIKVKVISIGPGGETRGLDERKWLTRKESAPTYTLIYNGKVAMISVDLNNKPIGVIIEDFNIFQTQRILFEFIWEKL
jgi:sugar-specific transcriptional regulator TrmB